MDFGNNKNRELFINGEKLVPSIFPTNFIAIRNMSFVVLNWYIWC